MFLWRFLAMPDWLLAHEDELKEAAPGRVALINLPGRVRSIVEITCETKMLARQLLRRFGGSCEKLPRDWEKKYLQTPRAAPLRIGRRLVVTTRAAALPNDRPQLVIPAAGAFGTGDHATTAMSLRLLEETIRPWPPGWRMLDLGTGTGILALAAARFGATEVVGIDHDPRAVAHAKTNARANKIIGARFVRQELSAWKPSRRFDLITANLFSELLIAAAPRLRRALRTNGRLIVSGILREQAKAVSRALTRAGFTIVRQRRRGKWIALLAAPKS
jgi:ribosomal protein L11 methyltransferase